MNFCSKNWQVFLMYFYWIIFPKKFLEVGFIIMIHNRCKWSFISSIILSLGSQSTLSSKIKMCYKNMTVLLHTYFYNISLRLTFFNIYNLPFLRSPNIGKIRFKVGQKTNYFSYILSSRTNRIAVLNNFSHWYVAKQETDKTVPAILFFPNIFSIIYFQLFSCKIRFQSSSS